MCEGGLGRLHQSVTEGSEGAAGPWKKCSRQRLPWWRSG